MGTVTLQTPFQDAFPAYEQTHPLPSHVRRAARALRQCRTAVLGGHIQACPDGPVARIWYNSCRHQSCPQCAYLQTERWLVAQRARLLACEHDPVIVPRPHDRNPLGLANVAGMTTRTGSTKPFRTACHCPSGGSPPPVTRQCTCGCRTRV